MATPSKRDAEPKHAKLCKGSAGSKFAGHRANSANSRSEGSGAGEEASKRTLPKSNRKEPIQARDLGGIISPECKESGTRRIGPILARLCESEGKSRWVKSGTEGIKPTLPIPKAGITLSSCPHERRSSNKSGCKKSKTSIEKPNLARLRGRKGEPRKVWSGVGEEKSQQETPKAGNVRPVLPGFLTKEGKPGCRESRVGIAESKRAMLRTEADGPRPVKSNTNSVSPAQAIPHEEDELSEHAGICRDVELPKLAGLRKGSDGPGCKKSSTGREGSGQAMLLRSKATSR